MDKKKKTIIAVIIAIVVAAALAAGLLLYFSDRPGMGTGIKAKSAGNGANAPQGGTAGGVVRIYADTSGEGRAYYDYAAKAFESEWPMYSLELIEASSLTDDDQTLKGYAASENLPDIFEVTPAMAETLAETGQTADLSDALSSKGGAHASAYADRLYDISKDTAKAEDGHIYYFPYKGQNVWLWYYDEALFEKAGAELPADKDGLFDTALALKSYGVTPMTLGGADDAVVCGLYDTLAVGFTADGIKGLDNGKSFSDSGYADAADLMGRLSEEGFFAIDAGTLSREDAKAQFEAGKSGMLLEDASYMSSLTDDKKQSVKWYAYPGADEGHFAGGGAVGGFAVDPQSAYGAEAIEMAAFFADKYTEAMQNAGNAVTATDASVAGTGLSDAYDTMVSVTTEPDKLTDKLLFEKLSQESRGLLEGRYSASEFIVDLQDALD